MRSLFLTLRVFSAMGGIEKVSRLVAKALYELKNAGNKNSVAVLSMYDPESSVDEKYFPATIFKGYNQHKSSFVVEAIKQGKNCDVVILSHVNLLLPGYLIKLFSKKTKIVLIAHGIEVWSKFSFLKRWMLQRCDHIFAVSNFTKSTMVTVHQLDKNKISVLNNCLDPFMQLPIKAAKNIDLLNRYNLHSDDIVLLTITRLSSSEQYKGYDNVLYAIKELKQKQPRIKYIIAGKYDVAEKERIQHIITELELEDNIIIPGFIPDDELALHFNIADIYIMPSKKEGFGIIFIEALYFGKPVIAGNIDGSVDALDNGKFGLLVNPDHQSEKLAALDEVIENMQKYIPDHDAVMNKFSYPVYKNNFKNLLEKL